MPPSAQLCTWKTWGSYVQGDAKGPTALLPYSRKVLGSHLAGSRKKQEPKEVTYGWGNQIQLGKLNVVKGLFGTQSTFSVGMAMLRWPQPDWLSQASSTKQVFLASRRVLFNMSMGKWVPSCDTQN